MKLSWKRDWNTLTDIAPALHGAWEIMGLHVDNRVSDNRPEQQGRYVTVAGHPCSGAMLCARALSHNIHGVELFSAQENSRLQGHVNSSDAR
jgi:hypothetical protein